MQILHFYNAGEKINWLSSIPFFIVHLMPFCAIFTGVSWFDIGLCIFLYYARMFFVTAGYHRYFSHRSYKLNRVMQFIMAFMAGTCAQKGPLWWASHHRQHHRYSDTEKDIHSPIRGFWWSHVGWILCDRFNETQLDQISDFAQYPELRWLDKWHVVPPIMLGAAVYLIGGASALFIGFFLSTVLLYHGVFLINSLAHVFGRRRYVTRDTSRNSLILALLTCGEGWHNNHHHYQSTAKQGFFWWEIDVSYYILKVMSWLRLVKDLRVPTQKVLLRGQVRDGNFDIGMFRAYYDKAAKATVNVQSRAGDFYDAKVKALEEFMDRTQKAAEELAQASSHNIVKKASDSAVV